jgi:hypothetical protein
LKWLFFNTLSSFEKFMPCREAVYQCTPPDDFPASSTNGSHTMHHRGCPAQSSLQMKPTPATKWKRWVRIQQGPGQSQEHEQQVSFAVTKYHKLCDLKGHFILSQFEKLEVWHQVVGTALSEGSRGGSFQLLIASSIPWLVPT